MTPEQYVIRCDNLGIVRMVAEKMVKQLEKRRISKTKMDFVTDDLPNISKIMNDSHCRPMHQKAFELKYGVHAKNQNKVSNTLQRQLYSFWTRVLKLTKE